MMKTILVLHFDSGSIKIAVFQGKKRILHGLVQNTRAPEKQTLDIEHNGAVIHEDLTGLSLEQVILKLISILDANSIHSAPESAVTVCVIPTDEEPMIALNAAELLDAM